MTGAGSGAASGPARPLPVPDAMSAPFWAAAARHELTVARCQACRSFAIPPDITCPHCGAADPGFEFEPVSGRGVIRSWTVVRQSFLPGFTGSLPFLLVDVELAEQRELRMIGRLLDGPDALLPRWHRPAELPRWHRPAELPRWHRPAELPRWHRPAELPRWHRPAGVRLGAPVTVAFEDLADGVSVPAFTLAGGA